MGMLLIVSVWLGLCVVYTGLGLAAMRLFGARHLALRSLLLAPWLGWCAGIVVLQLWHLFLPADMRALALIVTLGCMALVWQRATVFGWVKAVGAGVWFWVPVLVLVACWLANQAMTQPRIYDSGLYHLMAVRWLQTYPIVPGLANLMPLLGYNNSPFLFAATLNNGMLDGRCHQLASGLLVLWMMVRGVVGWRACLQSARASCADVFDAAVCMPVVVWMYWSGVASSPTPDAALFLLGLVAGSELLRLLGGEFAEEGRERRCMVLCIALLCAVMISAKLSAAPLGCAMMMLALFAHSGQSGRWAWMDALLAAGVACCVLGPWTARTFILTGYPAFPMAFTIGDVDWRVPAASVANQARVVIEWARNPQVVGEAGSHGAWFLPWLSTLTRIYKFDVVTPLALACWAVWFGVWRRREARGVDAVECPPNTWVSSPWLFLVPPIIGIVVWFVTAPEPRYAGASFWLVGAGAVALSLRGAGRNVLVPVLSMSAVLLFVLNVDLLSTVLVWQRDPGPARRGVVVEKRTASGLVVNVPATGDQCWDAPLPSTPYLSSSLRLRKPGDMVQGFTVLPQGR